MQKIMALIVLVGLGGFAVVSKAAKKCQATCNSPLGIGDGRDSQFMAFSTANGNNTYLGNYGTQNARLNKTSRPQGFRADSDKAPVWIQVKLGKEKVVTGFATQGYGDASVGQWITQFEVYYSDLHGNKKSMTDEDGNPMIFMGNKDSNSIVRNDVPMPVVTTSVMFKINKPFFAPNGMGLRLELYGCEKGYYFVVWVKLYYEEFYLELVDPKGTKYKERAEIFLNKVYSYLKSARGFLEASINNLGPKQFVHGTFLAAEVHIFCIPNRVNDLIAKLKMGLQTDKHVQPSNNLHFQLPISCDCQHKMVTINLAKSLSEARKVIFTNESFELEAKIETTCDSEQDYQVTWEVSWTCPPDADFTAVTDIDTLKKKTLKLSLDKYMAEAELSECYLFIRCVLKTDWNPEMLLGTDYGYLRIVKPPLVPSLLGVPHVVRGINSTIRLSANKSSDPLGGSPVSFSWFCRRDNELFKSRAGRPVDVPFRKDDDDGGCFGFGPGRLSSNESILLIDGNKMDGDQTYVFEVVVSKDGRNSSASHSVRVDNPFWINVSCQGNCGPKVSTTRRIILKSVCKGHFCHAIKRYRWNLYKFDDAAANNSRWVQEVNLEEMTLTYIDSPNLVIAGKGKAKIALQENITYKASALAFLSEDFAVAGHFTFLTNLSPRLLGERSGCFVTPQQGEVLITEFVVECIGWWDPDEPLTYQFSVRSNDTGSFTLQRGSSHVLRTRLPLGSPESDYNLTVEVQISDSQGSSTLDAHVVKVRPSSLTDYSDVFANISNYLQSGVVETATQYTYCILTDIRDDSKNITGEKKSKIKEGLLGKMATVEVQSIVRVSQMASVVDMATELANETTQLGQEKTLDLQNSAVAFLSSGDSSLGEDPDLLQQVAASILPGISNVQNAMRETKQRSEQESTPKENAREMDMPTNSTSDKRARLVLRSLHLIDSVGTVLLDTKVSSEKPSNFRLDSFNLTLEKQLSSMLSRKSIESSRGKVVLPSATTLFNQTLEGTQAVGTQLLVFEENPYDWHVSSREIKSTVMDFTLKRNTGNKLNISNLREPVQLWLPLKEHAPILKQKYFVKSSARVENIRYHRVFIPSDDFTATVEIQPEAGQTVEVFVSALQRPTPQTHNLSLLLPDYSSCQSDIPEIGSLNCTSNPYVFAVSSKLTGSAGLHYIGIRYNGSRPRDASPEKMDEAKDRLKSDCGNHNRRHKRSCVGVKDPPTTPPPTVIVRPTYNARTDLNYSMSVNMATCKYWSERMNRWTTEGCEVGLDSHAGKLQCLCTHLSAYGGNLFVEPNPIDFDKVWAAFDNLKDAENFIVLSTVCSIFVLYIVGLVLARRADEKDRIKVVANVYFHHSPADTYEYHVQVQTGIWKGYGTTANIGIIVYGENGRSEAMSLNDNNLPKVLFARGSVVNFTLWLRESLGPLTKIDVWHDDGGKSPAWFLQEIVITDSQTKEEWHFLGRRWLAVERGIGQVRAEIKVAKKTEVVSFKNLVYLRTLKSFLDDHLWLSIFTKAPHDLFSRCQRLSCCMLILYASMVVNAMFYQFGTDAKGQTVKLGLLEIGWTQIKIAIQSSVFTIPGNVLVILIFRNIRPPKVDQFSVFEIPKQQEHTGKLPYYFVYLGWFLSLTGSLVAVAFTIFYSLIWGANTANQWLTSALISISLDVFLIQPLKVITVATLLSMMFKKVPQKDKVIGSSLWTSHERSHCGARVLEGRELKEATAYRRKILQTSKAMKEMGLFFTFILLLMTFCYGNRTSSRYLLTKSVQDVFAKRSSDKNIPALWSWTKKFLIPGLYNVSWYNGQEFEYEEGLVSNRGSFMVGMPRLRQLRLKPENSCLVVEKEDALMNMFPKFLPSYSINTEDTTPYYKPGWIPVENFSYFHTEFELLSVCPKPWRFHSAEKLQTLSHTGQMLSYGGGGFVADLGYDASSARKVIHDLEEHRWIDENTAAVFVEFSLFEPSSLLFSSVRYLCERFQTGGSFSRTVVKTVTLYGVTDPNSRLVLGASQLLLILFITLFAFKEIVKIYYQGWAYFKLFWNWVELVQITAAVAAITVFLVKDGRATEFVTKVRGNPYDTSSIDYIMLLADMEVYLLSFVVFVVTVKLLRILRYNRHICELLGTLKTSIKPLLSCTFVYFVAVIPFSHVGFLLFGSSTFSYSTPFDSLRELLIMVLDGTIEFQELQKADRCLGPMFLFLYTFGLNILFVNMFITILLESHREMKNRDNEEDFFDAEIGEFMVSCFSKNANVAFGKLLALIKSCLKQKAEATVTRRNAVKRSSSPAKRDSALMSPHCVEELCQEPLGHCGEIEIGCSCENQTFEKHSVRYEDDHIEDILVGDSDFTPHCVEELFQEPLGHFGEIEISCSCENQTFEKRSVRYEDDHMEDILVGDSDFAKIRASLLDISTQLRQSISLPQFDWERHLDYEDVTDGFQCACHSG